mmetsp:Transcript_55792/g.179060  ORF Transcript_55792/g.179060 Transcript_55792/m.179060 type:complete len:218 (+) Transcript_55792:1213-1866(+)
MHSTCRRERGSRQLMCCTRLRRGVGGVVRGHLQNQVGHAQRASRRRRYSHAKKNARRVCLVSLRQEALVPQMSFVTWRAFCWRDWRSPLRRKSLRQALRGPQRPRLKCIAALRMTCLTGATLWTMQLSMRRAVKTARPSAARMHHSARCSSTPQSPSGRGMRPRPPRAQAAHCAAKAALGRLRTLPPRLRTIPQVTTPASAGSRRHRRIVWRCSQRG